MTSQVEMCMLTLEQVHAIVTDAARAGQLDVVKSYCRSGCLKEFSNWQLAYIYFVARMNKKKRVFEWFQNKFPICKEMYPKILRITKLLGHLKAHCCEELSSLNQDSKES